MRLIELYILRRILVVFFAVFIAAIMLTWTVQVLARINFLTTNSQTFLTVLKFSSLFIPLAIPLVIPFVLVIAVSQTLSTMNQDTELVVINAAGIPRSAVWRPVLILGLCLSLFSFFITNFIAPYARLNMRQIIETAHSSFINTLLQEGSFRELGNGIYFEIGERRTNGDIGRLFIIDQRDPNLDLFYYAVEGIVTNDQNGSFMIMKNGEFQRRDNKNNNISIIKFDTYTLDLSDFFPANQTITIYPKDQLLSYLLNPDPNDSHYQSHRLQYTAELHKRFTEWLYPIVFAFIVLTIAGDARSHREAYISASFSAVSLSLLVYWLGYFFAEHAENNLAYVPFLYIIPISISVLLIFMLLTNRRISLPVRWSDVLYRFFNAWRNKGKRSHYPNTGGTP
ncbi:MAG: lipopolysaccharide export system permease protein [Candidatus Tokpelaia sp. JSC189]|nr:MAG: lipopolysaccharide export system permease protein [Candidatus Tokpelaia sp. JSC189]